MKRVNSLIATIVLSTLTSTAIAQAAGAGADYNKAERERLQKEPDVERQRAQCTKDCDTIFRGQYAACGGYPLQSQPTCTLNIDKNKAKCYQNCK